MDFREISLPKWITVDATPFEQVLFECPPNSIMNGRFWLNGITDAGVALGFQGSRIFKRGLGAAALVGSAVVHVNERDAGAAAWVATLGMNGSNLVLTTTGAAGVVIHWSVAGFVEITSI